MSSNSVNNKSKATDEQSKAPQEAEIIERIAKMLNTGLDNRAIALIHDLLSKGVHPESIVDASMRHSDENDTGIEEGSKPRRLEEDTYQYLVQIEPKLKAFEDKIKSTDRNTEDEADVEIFVSNVIEEISQRIGSAMLDRNTNLIMERLCYLSSLKHLIKIMTSCASYAVFMARNRHSSHCLQAIMARVSFLLKNFGVDDDISEELKESLMAFVQPILKEIYYLSKDLNGSHVIRAVICALAGTPPIAQRKGKGSKHQHSVPLSEPLDKLTVPDMFYIDSKKCFGVPEEFHEALGAAAVTLIELSTRKLQAMAADPTSSAVLGLLVRILSNPALVLGGPELVDRLCKQILSYSTELDTRNDEWTKVVYAMAGDRAGSYFLESMIECCSVELFTITVSKCVIGKAAEYSQDNVANFSIQAIFRRVSAQLDNVHEDAKKDWTMLTSNLITEIVEQKECFEEIIERKGGVALWIVEAATTLSKVNQSKNTYIDIIGNALLSKWTKLSIQKDESSLSRSDIKSALLDFLTMTFEVSAKSVGNNENNPQQLVARQIGALIRAAFASDTGKTVQAVVCSLPSSALLSISFSGPLSRVILDSLLDSVDLFTEVKGGKLGTNATCLINNMMPIIPEIAGHFVGIHVFRKLFQRSSSTLKEALVVSIDGARDKLGQSKEGRGSLAVTHADLYHRKPDEWRQLVSRQDKASFLLAELDKSNISDKPVLSKPSITGDDESDDDKGETKDGQTKRKRKRKRPVKATDAKNSGELVVADMDKIKRLKGNSLNIKALVTDASINVR